MKASNLFMQVQQNLSTENMKRLDQPMFQTFKVDTTYEELREYLKSHGLNIHNIYLDDKGLYPFWYIEEGVHISMPTIDIEVLEMLQVPRQVELQAEMLQKYWDEGDFESYLGVVPKQFSFEMFFKLLPKIPTDQQYNVFIDQYIRNEYGFNTIDKEIVQKILSTNKGKVPEFSLNLDKEGYVTIYRGNQTLSTPPEEAYSWTTSITVAQMFATRFKGIQGEIYTAKVHHTDIVDYIKDRNEEEVLVLPQDLKGVRKASFIKYDETFKEELEQEGVYDEYNYLIGNYLNPDHYHNPTGIHGVTHIKRVLLLTLIMSKQDNLSTRDERLLSFAALYHDIGRTHDGKDDFHGKNSVAKMHKLNLPLPPNLTNEDRKILEFIIHYHAVPDWVGYDVLDNNTYIENTSRAKDLFKRFKDCDNLDRVRLGDLNQKFLRTQTAHKMIPLAYQIFEEMS